MLIQFPKRHVRASAASAGGSTRARAAQAVIIAADIPAWTARSVARIGAHHSAGILSRCHHFETVEAPAPMSDASASREGQSSMTERNEVGSAMMANYLGRIVLKGKAEMSRDDSHLRGQNVLMADRMSETEEKLAFIRRTRLARLSRYPEQKPMLTILGIEQGTYKQYETRTPLPHRYIPKFIAATGVTYEWFLTGEGKGPAQVEYEPMPKGRKARAPRQRAA